MTKAELIETLKDIPDDAVIDIYDLERFNHPSSTTQRLKTVEIEG